MIRVLTMIAAAGFLLSAVCLAVAIRLAGPELITEQAWDWNGHGWRFGHHGLTVDGDLSVGLGASRALAWTGADSLEIQLPAEVHFTQAEGPPKLTARGPKDVLDHLVVEGGRLRLDGANGGADDVTIELSAPKVTRFALDGGGRLEIDGYRQDRLEVSVAGDGAVTARGEAKAVKLAISGSGDADLSGLAADGAEVNVTGSGHARVGPRTWAKLQVSGSGGVTLLGHPSRVESSLTGSGTIDQDEDDAPAPPAPPAKSEQPV